MAGELSDGQRRDRLRLARTENVGPVAFAQLLARFGDARAALAALPDLVRRGGRAGPPRIPAEAEIDAEIEAGRRLGAQMIVVGEAAFPARLAALDPPPPTLWCKGRPELLHAPSVAVVGARIASAVGQRFARGLAAELGGHGYVVVSGLARGVDAAAHQGALTAGTIAVLGGGVDDVYPPEHRDLYARIAEAGCVVSESPVGHRAQARDFPRRNRIISGLSLGVVVVEAELRSGSLITARLAAEQGREVFAVPGSPLDPRARGGNDLIRNGAHLCEGVEDVLRELNGLRRLGEGDEALSLRAGDGDLATDEADIDRLREQIAALLSPSPAPRDELVRLTGAPARLVHAALVELALAGRAELSPGGLVSSC